MSDALKGMISCVSVCAMAALLLYDDARLILVGMDVVTSEPEPGEEWKAESNTHSLS